MVQVHPPAPPPTDGDPSPAERAVERLLAAEAPAPGERWIVAFSGGPDSVALAAAAARPASERSVELHLVHVDHRLDADSARRAERAGELANELGLPIHEHALGPDSAARRESPEAGARRRRYAALEATRREIGALRVLTAHHRDDQVETILLQLARGVALERLRGIPVRRGAVRRPLLDVPRAELAAEVVRRGLDPVDDPTNRDLGLPRNRLRHAVLPRLLRREPGVEDAVLALGRRAAELGDRLERLFAARLAASPAASTPREHSVPVELVAPGEAERTLAPLDWLLDLPEGLRPPALRWLLERQATPPLPAPRGALEAFLAELRSGVRRARIDLGADGAALALERGLLIAPAAPRPFPARFSYTFSIPGRLELPELGVAVRVERAAVAPWMRRGDPRRAGLAIEAGEATVRSRLPGDRLRPLGAPGRRKLKALLIDRGVPAEIRDRIPLLELAGRIAWIPGVTIAHEMAIGDERECWLAELEPIEALARPPERPPERNRI